MMRFTGVILSLAMSGVYSPDISIYDSKTHTGYSWILVDDCPVEVKTSEIKENPDKVVQKVNLACQLNLDHVTKEE